MKCNAEELTLIRKAQEGDEASFTALYTKYLPSVRAVCCRILRNSPNEVPDMVQEVFMHILRKLHLFKGDSAFSTWLYRVTCNEIFMHMRVDKRRILSRSDSLDEQVDFNDGDSSYTKEFVSNDGTLANTPERIALERSIESLPSGYRTIFILHDIEGFEHNEIAEMMNCSVGNSKSQLHKARGKLRQSLTPCKRRIHRAAGGAA